MSFFGLQEYLKSDSSGSRRDHRSFGRTSELGSEESYSEKNKSPPTTPTTSATKWNLFGTADDQKTLLNEPINTHDNKSVFPSNFSISHQASRSFTEK